MKRISGNMLQNLCVLKLWRLRNLTLEGRIIIFKTVALSKIIHLALVKAIPIATIDQLVR